MDPELKELLMRCKAEERSAQTALYRRFARVLLLIELVTAQLRALDQRDVVAGGSQRGAKIVADLTGSNNDDFHNGNV